MWRSDDRGDVVVTTAKLPASPYHESAAPAPTVRERWPRRLGITGGLLVANVIAGGVTWGLLPWKTHIELRAEKETLQPHERMASVWWSEAGWAIAVGAKGQVLLRDGSPNPSDPWSWRALPATTQGDLVSVAGGTFVESSDGDDEHAVAAGDGAILDCSRAGCVALVTEGHHRAVAVGDREALVVGDGGSVLWIVPWRMNHQREKRARADTELRAERIADLDLTTDFRAVDFQCGGSAGPMCKAVLTGADGVVVRGEHPWPCPQGCASGQCARCIWTWARDPAPVPRSDGGALRTSSPLHVVSTKLGAWSSLHVVSTTLGATTREHQTRALVVFGAPPYADVDGSWRAVRVDHRFVAAWPQWSGPTDATLLVDEAGDIYLAR